MTIEPKKQPAPCPLSPTKIKHHEYQSIIYFCAIAVRYCLRYRFGKNLARPELAFERPANKVYQVYLTPLLDNNQRGEIIEIYLSNGNASYMASKISTIGKPEYILSAENADTKHIMTCKEPGAFVNLNMALSLPDLPDTSY